MSEIWSSSNSLAILVKWILAEMKGCDENESRAGHGRGRLSNLWQKQWASLRKSVWRQSPPGGNLERRAHYMQHYQIIYLVASGKLPPESIRGYRIPAGVTFFWQPMPTTVLLVGLVNSLFDAFTRGLARSSILSEMLQCTALGRFLDASWFSPIVQ